MKRNRAAALCLTCAAVLWCAPVMAQQDQSAARTQSTQASQQPTRAPAQSPPTAAQQTGSGQAEALSVPDRAVWLGTVQLPVEVMADGQPLSPGTYRVRLNGEHAKDDVVGQSEQLERWVEFVQSGKVKGRAMAPVVPSASAREVVKRPLPSRGTVRAERMKEDQYYRPWFNYQGDQVLVYLPIA